MNMAKRLFIVGILCLMVMGTFSLPPQKLQAQTDEQAVLDAILDQYVAEDDPGVVVLVTVGDEQWVSARGLADLANGIPIADSDSFRIGSITKTFVSTIVLQLAEDGMLELDAPLTMYLPAEITDNIEYSSKITLRHLLTMQSGVFDYTESDDFWDEVDANPSYAWTAEDTLDYVLGQAAYFAPGEEFYYTNTNYILLELIIQEVTGMTLGGVMTEYIFEPLGMTHSYMEDGANLSPDIVQGYGYYDNDDELDNITLINEGVGLGDGGIISTAYDLDIFIRALLTSDLLTEDSLAEMLAFDTESGYGLGISYEEVEGLAIIGHDGATAGFQSSMYYAPELAMSIIVLTNNFDSEVIEDIVDETWYIAFELSVE